MALDTTTGGATAESYITVADADAYFLARGVTAWAALTTAAKEAALRKSTDYMVQTYISRWSGVRVTSTQALDWPRAWVDLADNITNLAYINGAYVDSTTIPVPVQRACAELALKASSADLLADQEQAIVREKIGPIETEYDRYSSQAKRYPAVERMLQPYLTGKGGANVRLERA